MIRKYPNLHAILIGTIAGNFRCWPVVGAELRTFISEVERLKMSSKAWEIQAKGYGKAIDTLESERDRYKAALEVADRRIRDVAARSGGPAWVDAKRMLQSDMELIHDGIHEALVNP